MVGLRWAASQATSAPPKAPLDARRALSWATVIPPTTSTNAYGVREVQSVLSSFSVAWIKASQVQALVRILFANNMTRDTCVLRKEIRPADYTNQRQLIPCPFAER